MKKIFTLIAAAFAALTVNAGEIFSVMLVEGAADLEIEGQSMAAFGTDYSSDNYTMTAGARVEINNGHSNAKKYVSGGKFNLNGSGGSSVYVGLPSGVALKAGDVIRLVNATQKGGAVSFDDGKVSSDNMNDANEYTISEAEAGNTSFYIWRGASKPTFQGIVVERNEGQTIAPAIEVSGKTVVMSCGTEGASIYYGTAPGVTAATGTLYSAPIAITQSVTYYAIAVKDGLEASKEVNKVVEYYAIPSTAKFGATLEAPTDIAEGGADEELSSLTSGTYTATSDGVLSNSAAWQGKAAFKGLVKVKGNVTIATTGSEDIVGIKVIGIANSSSTQVVTAADMYVTTDGNILPSRDGDEPGTIEFVAAAPAKSFVINIAGQSRVKFEVYTGTSASVNKAQAAQGAAAPKKVLTKNGIVINGKYNVAGAQVK